MPSAPRKLRSLGELRHQREQAVFVGRDDQIAALSENLRLAYDAPQRKFLVNIYGQGGMGKSWLAHHFLDLARAAGAAGAWSDEGETSPVLAMRKLASDLNTTNDFKDFLSRERDYREHLRDIQADPDLPDGLAGALGAGLGKGGVLLGREIPIARILFDHTDEDVAAARGAELLTYLSKKLRGRKDAVELVRDPLGTLTPLFMEGLFTIAERHLDPGVVLVLDTYEETREALEPWLLDVLTERYGAVPANLLLLIVGRDSLDPNEWGSYVNSALSLPLDLFSEHEANALLDRAAVTDPEIRTAILAASERLPLMLATLAYSAPTSLSDLADPGDTAVERFLKWIPTQDRRGLALKASLPRKLNQDIIAALGSQDAMRDFIWLRSTPFVQEHASDWRYHRVVRDQMLRHMRKESPTTFSEMHLSLAAHFEGDDPINQDRASLSLDATYHRLCADFAGTISSVIDLMFAGPGLGWKRAFAFLEVIRQAENDVNVLATSRWSGLLAEYFADYDDDDPSTSIRVFSALLDQLPLSDRTRGWLFKWRGDAYVAMRDMASAERDIAEALQALPGDPDMLAARAQIKRGLSDFSSSLDDLENALSASADSAQKARILTLIGETLSASGEYGLAVARLGTALELEPESLRARIALARAYRQTGDHPKAIGEYEYLVESVPSFKHEGLKEIAITYLESDRLRDARKAAEESLAESPPCSHCWTLLARIAVREEGEDPARKLFDASTIGDRSDPFQLAAMAYGLDNVGETEGAESYVTRALELDPENRWAIQLAAEIAYAKSNYQEAIALVEKFDAVSRERGGRLLRAYSLSELGAYDDALTALQPLLVLGGDLAIEARVLRALLLSYTGRFEQAIAENEALNEELGGSPSVTYNLAVATACLGTDDVAAAAQIDAAHRALDSVDDLGMKNYGLAGLAALDGDAELAITLAQEACAISEDARRWIRHDAAFKRLRASGALAFEAKPDA